MPADIVAVTNVAYDLRLIPVLAVVGITGAFFWIAGLRDGYPRLGGAVLALVLLLLPWTLWEHALILYNIRNFQIDVEQTAVRNRTENLALEWYSWALLPPPRFINYGVMDPALETRFWSDSDRRRAMIDPDAIERALETPGQKPVDLVATPIPTGPNWLTLTPTIELDPGQHVLLRFDFLGHRAEGFLIIQSKTIYREYHLPASGREYAFGMDPGNTRTLSLWNSGKTHESVQLLVTQGAPFEKPGPGAYWRVRVTPYDAGRSPIALTSLTPLKFRFHAPTAGYIETFRSLIPGYKVYVDGKPAAVLGSRNALVSFRVTPGNHEAWVRFAGTVRLHTAIRWAITAWLAAAAAGVFQLGLMCRPAAASRPRA